MGETGKLRDKFVTRADALTALEDMNRGARGQGYKYTGKITGRKGAYRLSWQRVYGRTGNSKPKKKRRFGIF